jgi:hypothetical protein
MKGWRIRDGDTMFACSTVHGLDKLTKASTKIKTNLGSLPFCFYVPRLTVDWVLAE